jgi:hypothetical protein
MTALACKADDIYNYANNQVVKTSINQELGKALGVFDISKVIPSF